MKHYPQFDIQFDIHGNATALSIDTANDRYVIFYDFGTSVDDSGWNIRCPYGEEITQSYGADGKPSKWDCSVLSKGELYAILCKVMRKKRAASYWNKWRMPHLETLAKLLEKTDLQKFLPPIVELIFKKRIKEGC